MNELLSCTYYSTMYFSLIFHLFVFGLCDGRACLIIHLLTKYYFNFPVVWVEEGGGPRHTSSVLQGTTSKPNTYLDFVRTVKFGQAIVDSHGTMYVGSSDNHLYALRPETGFSHFFSNSVCFTFTFIFFMFLLILFFCSYLW